MSWWEPGKDRRSHPRSTDVPLDRVWDTYRLIRHLGERDMRHVDEIPVRLPVKMLLGRHLPWERRTPDNKEDK